VQKTLLLSFESTIFFLSTVFPACVKSAFERYSLADVLVWPLLIKDHVQGVHVTCLMASCRTEADASQLTPVGHRSDRHLLVFAVC